MKNTKQQSGFTLVEILVAISIFAVAVSISTGGFTQALRTQRQAAALIAANSNVSLAIEQMVREMRGGINFSTDSADTGCPSSGIFFERYRGRDIAEVRYCLENETITRSEDGALPEPIVAENALVRNLIFFLLNDPNFPPRITIVIGVGPKDITLTRNVTYIQTTVSPR